MDNNKIGPQVREKKSLVPKGRLAFIIFLSIIYIMQVATQFLAFKFKYHYTLGASLGGIYTPWSSIVWWVKWGDNFPSVFQSAITISTMAYLVFFLILITVFIQRKKPDISKYLHGSARWANKKDIKKAGLLDNEDGVYVGAYVDDNGEINYLRHNGAEHVLTAAPTRSGKGVGLVIPTLLSWKQSVVITDLKGELWAFTAGWRKKYAKNKVIRFEPASSTKSAKWNPIDEIRIGTDMEVGDVQNMATLIVDPDGRGVESHWQKTSQALLVGLILHLIYKLKNEGTPANFANIDNMLVDPNLNIADLLLEMTQYHHLTDKTHPVVYASARDMIDRPEEEAGSVLSTLKSYVSLYRDPVVAKNVSSSDFSIRDLMYNKDPVSLYIIPEPTDKDRLKPLVRLLLNMVVRILASGMEFERKNDSEGFSYVTTKKKYNHRLLCMIDEFPSLGKLDIIQESLAFVAGYGIKFYLICQDLNQLRSKEKGYGPDETITSNCHIQNAYQPLRLETAEYLSKLTGVTTVVKEHITTSGRRLSAFLPQVSKTVQEFSRPLLTPDECQRMPGPEKDGDLITKAGDMLIYVAGFPAIYGRQPLYFQDPVFKARASIVSPEHSCAVKKKYESDEDIKI